MGEDVLDEAGHVDFMGLNRGFRHAGRGIAYAAKGDSKAARTEQAAYVEASRLVPDNDMFGNNSCQALLKIVSPMVEGEILVREGKVDEGLAQFPAAVTAQDSFHYDEP